MDLAAALLDSWDRQCRILDNLIGTLDERLLAARPSDDGWSVATHLAHLLEVRAYWLRNASGQPWPELLELMPDAGGEWNTPIELNQIREQHQAGHQAVRKWMTQALETGITQAGNYAHPVHFLEHMIWHDGYHFGLLMLALRRAGAEPTDEWEEENVWGLWRASD